MRKRGAPGVLAGVAAVAAAGTFAAAGDAGAQRQASAWKVGVDDPGLKFAPAQIEISVGDTVQWDFTGSTSSHNAASENAVAADPEWESFDTQFHTSGSYPQPPRQFKAVGEYEFICLAHPATMRGRITVVEGPTTPPEPTPRPVTTPAPAVQAATPVPTADHSRDTPAPTARAGADKTAPALSNVTARKAGATGARVKWTLSEPAALTVRFQRAGNRTVLRTVRLFGRPGTSAVTVRGARLKRGRYVVGVEARDAAGNRSPLTRTTVRIGKR